jgi:RNA polymerase sigma-70 factor (sigma-E family)
VTEQTWFAELYDRCYEGLVLTAYAMTNDLGAAEEITQEAFAVAYGRQGRVRRADSPEAWLRTVVMNLARRRFRRIATLDRILRRQQAEPPPRTPPPDEHLDLHAAIGRLGQEHRTVVVLHYLADLPVDEVAAVLGVPVGTVKSRLARARAALADRLRTEVDHV